MMDGFGIIVFPCACVCGEGRGDDSSLDGVDRDLSCLPLHAWMDGCVVRCYVSSGEKGCFVLGRLIVLSEK